MTDQEAYNELSYYTLAHKSQEFIHQYIVDAYAAQHADETSKPIYLAFALAGLYLHNEKHYSGKEVQLAHMQLAKEKKEWPVFKLPTERGAITVHDVLTSPPGTERDKMIQRWSAITWNAFSESRARVIEWLRGELKI